MVGPYYMDPRTQRELTAHIRETLRQRRATRDRRNRDRLALLERAVSRHGIRV